MPRKLRISIIGCGAIGSSLARGIKSRFLSRAVLSGLYDIDRQRSLRLARQLRSPGLAVKDLETAIRKADLLIEAAAAGASFGIAMKAVSAGRDIMVMSVGGLLQGRRKLEDKASRSGSRVFIPSGAISGIDALRASRFSGIKKVTLITAKPPQAFSGVPYILRRGIILSKIKKDKVIFEGSALKATRAFQQNVNVAATLSLAGIGPHKTRVRIVASPGLKRNMHRIEIESGSGRIVTSTENVIHPANPKTSYLAVLAALATLEGILGPFKIGN